VLSVDFKSTELEIGLVEAPKYSEDEIDQSDNPPSQLGLFRMLTVEESDERLQSIAESG
jgi:hypothetical protein